MLNERPPGTTETICPVDQTPCEGQGADADCAVCDVKSQTQETFVGPLEYIPPEPNYYTVDHRYANSQIRYRLLQWLVTETMTLEEISAKSGLSDKHLISMCLGKSGVAYMDMARLAKALFGPDIELFVAMHWTDCGVSYSEENACPEDAECVKLLEQGQREGKVPTKVW